MFHLVDALNELERFATEAVAQGNPSRDRLAEVQDRYRAAILDYNLATISLQIAYGASESLTVVNTHTSTTSNFGAYDQSLEDVLKREFLLLQDEVRTLRDDSIALLSDASQLCSEMVSQPALAAD
jgi:hypothetical protein